MPEQAVQTVPAAEALLQVAPGDRIRATARIVGHDETWLTQVEGEVLSVHSEPTGAWYAHGKDDRLWLLRVVLRKDDGEISSLVVDQNMELEVLSPRP